MADDAPTYPIFEVPFLRLFPWLRLFQAPGLAADPKRLMLAAVGLLLLSAGWTAIDRLVPGGPGWASDGLEAGTFGAYPELGTMVARLAEPAGAVLRPLARVFTPGAGAWATVNAALATLWALSVWSLFGGAIARIAAFRLCRGERLSLTRCGMYTSRKLAVLLGTPLLPFVGVVLTGLGLALFGLLYRVPALGGPTIAGVLGFLPLLGGLVMTLTLVGLGFGWPLMTASVAAEDDDAFDAMSRSYAYVRQRPWLYLAYTVVALAAGLGGLFFVDFFAHLVVHLSAWGLSLGGGSDEVLSYLFPGSKRLDPEFSRTNAASAHAFWLIVVGLLVRAWSFSYFWTCAETIYLLLRRDVDGTPIHLVATSLPPTLLAEAAAATAAETAAFSRPSLASATPVPAPHAPIPDSGPPSEPA